MREREERWPIVGRGAFCEKKIKVVREHVCSEDLKQT